MKSKISAFQPRTNRACNADDNYQTNSENGNTNGGSHNYPSACRTQVIPIRIYVKVEKLFAKHECGLNTMPFRAAWWD
jgi:hypothetical protein